LKGHNLGRHDFRRPFEAGTKKVTRAPNVPATEIAHHTAQSLSPENSFKRPSAPSGRFRNAQMGRSAFLKLVGCWIGGVLALLVLAIVIRIAA
jgi:hypothetical protein